MNKRTAVVALMADFTLAICFIILGSVSTDLMAALELDAAQFGSLIMALFLTSCIVQSSPDRRSTASGTSRRPSSASS